MRRHTAAKLVASVVALGASTALLVEALRLAPARRSAQSAVVATPSHSPIPSAAPPTTSSAPPIRVEVHIDGMLSWAIAGFGGITAASDNADAAHSTTESMVKPWIAADYLRRNPAPSGRRLAELTSMIVDSSDAAAEDIYRAGGGAAVIERMITICGLAETQAVPGWWSRTEITAADTARLGACLADGRAAGGGWTPWLLDRMRDVRGEGRFGAVQALPDAGLAIKNGWTLIGADGNWHVSCLAIGSGWSLGVLVRYPARHGLAYGADACANVARHLVVPVIPGS